MWTVCLSFFVLIDVEKEIEEQFISNQGLIDGMMKTFEERLAEMRSKLGADDDTIYDYSAPHLVNVNEDPLLNGKIFFNLLAIPILYVGRKNGKPKPHVILNGVGIQSKHSRIMNNDGRIYLVPQNVTKKTYKKRTAVERLSSGL